MHKLSRSLLLTGALAMAGLAGCGDDVSITEPTPGVTGVTVTGAPTVAINVGQTVQLSASVATVGDAAKTVNWSSSNPAVATVDANGLVTAVGPGTASITATSTVDPAQRGSVSITVTRGVSGITISPASDVLIPGQSRQLVANVAAGAGIPNTVTWSSSNPAVATVDANGVVTALTVGTAQITATSTVDPSIQGFMALTVREPAPTTVTVNNITRTGNTTQTINANNVTGSIDVNLNVDPGENVVERVEVLLDGEVVCSQDFTGAESQALRLAAAGLALDAEAAPQPVTCQINTAQFDAETGIADFLNGQHVLQARAVLENGEQVATPSTTLTFNNQSGFIVLLSSDNGDDPDTAIDPRDGLQWMGGDVSVRFVGVSYIPDVTIANVGFQLFGKTRTQVLTNGSGTVTFDEDVVWTPTNLGVGDYLSPDAGEAFNAATAVAVLSNGQQLQVAPGTTAILNFGAPAQGNANVPALQTVRLDNVAPGEPAANITVPADQQQPIVLGDAPIWVNANTVFGAGEVGIPAAADLSVSDLGVDAVTATVYVGEAGSLPGGAAPGALSPECDVTGLTAITRGSDLDASNVSTAYEARIVFRDALGNETCMDLNPINPLNAADNGTFGADFVAPTGTVAAGPSANEGFMTAAGVDDISVTATDNASGFGATPLQVVVTRMQPNGDTDCVIGTGATCAAAARALTFDPVDGDAGADAEGYYTETISLVDQAGNATVLQENRVFLVDDPAVVAPGSTSEIGFTGGISLPALIGGNATNAFTATAVDDIDLDEIYGVTAFGTANIRHTSQQLGSFGVPFERGGTAINYAVNNWIRCLNVAGDFSTTTNQAQTIALTVSDQAGNTATQTSAAFGANAQACDAVGNTAINSFAALAASYGTGKTQVDIDAANLATASATTVTLTVVADVPLNTSNDPFARVEFYWQDTDGNWRLAGSATGVLAQTPTERTWTYTFVWDPSAEVQAGNVNVVAIGVDAEGDAVLSNGATVVTVP